MRGIKKWRTNLQTIEFPNHKKYTDKEILTIIFKDVPERLALLKWIAMKISDEDPAQFNMTKEDVGKFFCDRGLLSASLEKDFIQARCSQEVQEDTWKTLFSFTRMHKFLNPPKIDRVGIQGKFPELLKSCYEERFSFMEREPSVTIEEVESEVPDSDMERIVDREVSEIKKEMERRSNLKVLEAEENMKKEMEAKELKKSEEVMRILGESRKSHQEDRIKSIHDAEEHKDIKPNYLSRNKQFIPVGNSGSPELQSRSEFYLVKDDVSPLFSTPHSIEDIKVYGNEIGIEEDASENVLAGDDVKFGEGKMPSGEWFRENDVIPRIFVMPGSPPLGHLDPSKIKIVAEDSATPITLDGRPYHNHSQWQYRIYETRKASPDQRSYQSFEEFKQTKQPNPQLDELNQT